METGITEPGPELDRAVAAALDLNCEAGDVPAFSTDPEAADDVSSMLRAKVYVEPLPSGISVIMLAHGLSTSPRANLKGTAVGRSREHAICLAALDMIERHGVQVYGSRVNWSAPSGR